MKISTIYFSPTGNTKKSVNEMASAIAFHIAKKSNIDAGSSQAFAEYDSSVGKYAAAENDIIFASDDFVIFGAPVYAGRIPEVAKMRLLKFKGTQTPCIIVASYGNRHYDDALLEMKDMVEANGFVVKGGAAVIGRHTYGEIQVDRPNAADMVQMAEFAVKAFENENVSVNIPGNPVYREGGKGGKFKPSTLDTCVKCGICKRNCPVNAINDDFSVFEPDCISCFRCIRNCPVKAKVMNSESYLQFAEDFTNKLAQRRENEFFL